MIPLRDSIRSRSFAFVNLLLILANFAVFMHELSLSAPGLGRFLARWAMDPARVAAALRQGILAPGAGHAYVTLVTAEFIHGGWLHILGNMVFLWVFGDNVEDRMGHGRYLIFYILVGVLGNVVFALLNPAATVPTIGASGSIAGVLGAYLLSYPRARVLTVILIVFFPLIVSVPAVLLLVYWFALQLLNGLATLGGDAAASGVAWWAHVGGFVAGMVLLPLFARRPARRAGRHKHAPACPIP